MVDRFPILLIEWLRQEYDVTDMWVVEGMVELHIRDWRIVFVLIGKPHHIEIAGRDYIRRDSLTIGDNCITTHGKTLLAGEPTFFEKMSEILTNIGISPHVPGTVKPTCVIHKT